MINRQLESVIIDDLKQKMVLLAGPRQCGKTTLAEEVARRSCLKAHYYTWDSDGDRKSILHDQLDEGVQLWILDELHKYTRWRNWLKGHYDKKRKTHRFLVTGSAKLDAYSRGGDSLQGRYFFHRLHPFVFSEVLSFKSPASPEELVRFDRTPPGNSAQTLDDLLLLGGFPEPFLSGSERQAARWRLSYGSRLVREEIRSLERILNLDGMELLFDKLPFTVGSVLSINSLREDLNVAFETVRLWISIFEKLYAVFRLPPYGAPKIKAVKKEQKLYFWEWAYAPDKAQRLENMVALHLLRYVHWMADVNGEKWELRYFRDAVGHEVDFILLRKGRPWAAIEVKSQEQSLDPNLKYFLERVKVPYAFQISLGGKKDWKPEPINGADIRVMPLDRFLAQF